MEIKVGQVILQGDLEIPKGSKGIILFAHGSGSSRHSPRNRAVAATLQKGGLGTLLIDLLTEEEEVEDEVTAHLRFDIPMLAERLTLIIDWLKKNHPISIGCFGASTGAAAALVAAAKRPDDVKAVVSRGGRPDLAESYLSQVKAPTLLIVGGADPIVIDLNKKAKAELKCENELVIVPRATHLFEESGALEKVAALALEWFKNYL